MRQIFQGKKPKSEEYLCPNCNRKRCAFLLYLVVLDSFLCLQLSVWWVQHLSSNHVWYHQHGGLRPLPTPPFAPQLIACHRQPCVATDLPGSCHIPSRFNALHSRHHASLNVQHRLKLWFWKPHQCWSGKTHSAFRRSFRVSCLGRSFDSGAFWFCL